MLVQLKASDVVEVGGVSSHFYGYAGFNDKFVKPLFESIKANKRISKFLTFKRNDKDYVSVTLYKQKEFDNLFNLLETYGVVLSDFCFVFNRDLSEIFIPNKLLSIMNKANLVNDDTIVDNFKLLLFSIANLFNLLIEHKADQVACERAATDWTTKEGFSINLQNLDIVNNDEISEVKYVLPAINFMFSSVIKYKSDFNFVYNRVELNGKEMLYIFEKNKAGDLKIVYILTDNKLVSNASLQLWQANTNESFIPNLVVNMVKDLGLTDGVEVFIKPIKPSDKPYTLKIATDAGKYYPLLEKYTNACENYDTRFFKTTFPNAKVESEIVSLDLSSQYKDDALAQQLYKQVQKYYDDVDLKELTNCVKGFSKGEIYSLFFEGASGTGKSTAAKVIPSRCGLPFVVKNFSTNSEESDLIGTMIPNPNKKNANDAEFIWKDGILTRAVRRGYCFIGEEVNFARPGVLGMLNSLLDESKQVELPTGEIVKAHPNFRIIVTCNIGYEGTNRLNKAFVNRFEICRKFKDLDFNEICKVLDKRCGYTDKSKISVIVDVYKAIKKYSNELNLDLVVSIRQLMNIFTQGKYYKTAKEALNNLMLDQVFLEDPDHLENFKKNTLEAFSLDFKI